MLDFHKYALESRPFLNNSIEYSTNFSLIMQQIRNDNPDDVFRNSWGALVMRKIPFALQGDFSQLPPSFQNDTRVWKSGLLGAFSLMLCNITGTFPGEHLNPADSVSLGRYVYVEWL